jgi:hypothetical protein
VDCSTLKKNGPAVASGVKTLGQVRCFTFAGTKAESLVMLVEDPPGSGTGNFDIPLT